MMTLTVLLLLAAFVVTIMAAMGKVDLWIGVLLVILAVAVTFLPGRL
jgi:hypothetical protein